MKKQIIRIMSLVLTLAMVLTLGACGSKGASSDVEGGAILDFEDEKGDGFTVDSDQPHGADADIVSQIGTGVTITEDDKVDLSSDDPFANIPKRLRGSTVVFACWGDEGHDKYKKVYQEFTKKTGIKVQIRNVDQNTYLATVAQQIAAGNSPDVLVDCYNFANQIEILQPMQNLIDINDPFWDQNIIKISTIKGNTYEVSSNKSCWQGHQFILYNKKLFATNSITSPGEYYSRGQWTYENALKCMREITKISGNYGGVIMPDLIAASLGTPIVSYDTTKAQFVNNISSANVLAGYQFYATIKEEKIWETGMWYTHFNNGNVGLYDGDVYSAKFNGRFSTFEDSALAAVPMPTSYQGKPTKQVGLYRAYGIAKNAKNPSGAAYFLRWFLDYSKYEEAGVKVFKNDSLKDFYYNTYVPLIEKEGINYSFYQTATAYLNEDSNTFIHVDDSGKDQITGLLDSKKNKIDGAVDALNAKLK
ncbi:MAG: extracellular solute-binding protein [Clostridia bacterium]|nr:extracellular solute-binding protein [Clostridia bacterium]